MAETFHTSDGKYISAKDAAEKFGYTSDYLGQLARKGKIDSKLVGHTRFLERGSLEHYINSANGKKNGNEIKKPPLNKATSRLNEISGKPKSKGTEAVKTFEVLDEPSMPLRPEPVRILSKKPVGVDAEETGGKRGNHSEAVGKVISLSVALLLVFGVYSFFMSGSTVRDGVDSLSQELSIIEERVALENQRTRAGALDSVRSFLRNLFSRFAFEDGESENSNLDEANEESDSTNPEPLDPSPQVSDDSGGIVVLPTTGETETDAEAIAQIKRTFSDEVDVEVDEDGLSGIIKPIFKDTTIEQSYLYVLVPVEDD